MIPLVLAGPGSIARIIPTHKSIPESLGDFKAIFADDPDEYERGQFAWTSKLIRGLDGRLGFDRDDDPSIDVILAMPSNTCPNLNLEQAVLFTALSRDTSLFDRARVELLNRMSPPGVDADDVRAMLTQGSAAQGIALYQDCATEFQSFRLLGNSSPFASRFSDQVHTTYRTLHGLFLRSLERCFDFGIQMVHFINNDAGTVRGRGNGPRGLKGARLPGVPALSNGNITSRVGALSGPISHLLGDVARYGPGLAQIVADMKTCLDLGFMIRTGVISGLTLNGPVNTPDHFIFVIGYDDGSGPEFTTRFLFWDPDAEQANASGPGFGFIHYVTQAQHDGAHQSEFVGGRLGTAQALEEDLVIVDGVDGGHFALDPPHNKRYQVTSVARV